VDDLFRVAKFGRVIRRKPARKRPSLRHATWQIIANATLSLTRFNPSPPGGLRPTQESHCGGGLKDFSSDLCRIHRVANVLGVSAVDNTRRAPIAARVAAVGLAPQAQEMTP